MRFLQKCKYVSAKHPASENATAADGVAIDTLGWNELAIILQIGAIGAADMDSLKVQNSPDNSVWTDVTGGAFTAPVQTADNTVAAGFFTVPATRYYRIQSDAGAVATLLSALAILSRGNETPSSTTERGITQSLIV